MSEEVLIIEDSEDDVLMIKRGFARGKTKCGLHRCSNAKDALEFLESAEGAEIRLVTLDLNMEVMNGFEFLEWRSQRGNLRKVPVVVFSSSARHEDVERAYILGANSYVEKPLDPSKYMEAILSIEEFWLCDATVM